MSDETTQTAAWPTRPEMITPQVAPQQPANRVLYVHDVKHVGSAEGNEVSKWFTIIGMSVATCGLFPLLGGIYLLIEKYREKQAAKNGVPYKTLL